MDLSLARVSITSAFQGESILLFGMFDPPGEIVAVGAVHLAPPSGAVRSEPEIGFVEIAEQHAEFTGIGLAEEGVDFLDQRRDAGLFVHRLVGQRAEFAAQRGDHPAREVEVTLLGGAEVLLDRDQLLLRDKAVPAAQRLGVLRRVRVIGGHVGAHDLGGVLGDVEAGGEAVLDRHARSAFGIDRGPARSVRGHNVAHPGDGVLVGHKCLLSILGRGLRPCRLAPLDGQALACCAAAG